MKRNFIHCFRGGMFVWVCRLSLLIGISSMSGCIPIPWFQKKPFSEEALAFIEPGVTDRGKIESILGKPDTERNDGLLSIYSKARLMAFFISQYGIGGAGTEHMLLIHYDANNVAQRYEVLRLGMVPGLVSAFKQACTKDGLCVGEGPYQRIIVFNLPEMDSEAKLFETNANQCSIYIYYTDWSSLGSNIIDLCPLKGSPQFYSIYEGSYFYMQTAPGQVTIDANTLQEDRGACITRFEFKCKPGQNYFVHAHESMGIWKGNSIHFSIADPAEGKKAIMDRRLMLP